MRKARPTQNTIEIPMPIITPLAGASRSGLLSRRFERYARSRVEALTVLRMLLVPCEAFPSVRIDYRETIDNKLQIVYAQIRIQLNICLVDR